MFVRTLNLENKYLRVYIYINIRLTRLHFSLRKDIFNYKNINLVSFFNNRSIYFLINIYSDNYQSALKYLKDTKINLNNVLIIIGDFNIRGNDWNLLYLHYSIYPESLKDTANSLNLGLLTPINQVSTQYINNSQDLNLVIDLVFLLSQNELLTNYNT